MERLTKTNVFFVPKFAFVATEGTLEPWPEPYATRVSSSHYYTTKDGRGGPRRYFIEKICDENVYLSMKLRKAESRAAAERRTEW